MHIHHSQEHWDFIIYKLKILSNILIYKYMSNVFMISRRSCSYSKANIENTCMNEYVFNARKWKGMISIFFRSKPRLQHTGVSMQKDLIGLENSLRNMGTPLNKDHINKNDYKAALLL